MLPYIVQLRPVVSTAPKCQLLTWTNRSAVRFRLDLRGLYCTYHLRLIKLRRAKYTDESILLTVTDGNLDAGDSDNTPELGLWNVTAAYEAPAYATGSNVIQRSE